MKASILTLAGGLVLLSAASVQAEPYYPWCADYGGGRDGIGATICSFTTREQCMASVSGVGGFCVENPQDPPAAAKRARRKK